jgi:hypothetical protein
LAEYDEVDVTTLPAALKFSLLDESNAAEVADECYLQWKNYFETNERNAAVRNWKNLCSESDELETIKAKQLETGKTRSTYYRSTIFPAIISRTATMLDAVNQNSPLLSFKPEFGSIAESVLKQQDAVNHYLENDDFAMKEIESIIDSETFRYSVTKCSAKPISRNTLVREGSGSIELNSGGTLDVADLRANWKQARGEDLPKEALEGLVSHKAKFVRQVTSVVPTHDNVPFGRFVFDNEMNSKEHWRFCGDISLVPFVTVLENEDIYDADQVKELFRLLKDKTQTVGEYNDFYWEVTEDSEADPDRRQTDLLAILELYIKTIENGDVKIKRMHIVLNLDDPKAKTKNGKSTKFILSKPHDSPFQLFDYPYVMSFAYKLPHAMRGISTADLGADGADMINQFWNLAIDKCRWTIHNMILMRKGVKLYNTWKQVPGRLHTMSDISDNSVRVLNVGQGGPNDMLSLLGMADSDHRNQMAAADIMQGVESNGSEQVGAKKMRFNSSMVRLNLTGIYIADRLCQIGAMFRDICAQIVASGQPIKLGGQELGISAEDFMERSTVTILNMMRLGLRDDELVKAKESMTSFQTSQIYQQAVAKGDLTGEWESLRRYQIALGVRDVESIIGKKPELPPPPAPVPPESPQAGQPGAPPTEPNPAEPVAPAPEQMPMQPDQMPQPMPMAVQ